MKIKRSLFKEMLDALERSGCKFWACEGPDKRPQHMKTCCVCSAIRHARQAEAKDPKPQRHKKETKNGAHIRNQVDSEQRS